MLHRHLLYTQLFPVAEGEAVISKGTQHNGRVHDILLKAQEPYIEALEPHQLRIL